MEMLKSPVCFPSVDLALCARFQAAGSVITESLHPMTVLNFCNDRKCFEFSYYVLKILIYVSHH